MCRLETFVTIRLVGLMAVLFLGSNVSVAAGQASPGNGRVSGHAGETGSVGSREWQLQEEDAKGRRFQEGEPNGEESQEVRVVLRDGSMFKAQIVEMGPEEVVLDTSFGRQRMSVKLIERIYSESGVLSGPWNNQTESHVFRNIAIGTVAALGGLGLLYLLGRVTAP
jgi:hypothetical protein